MSLPAFSVRNHVLVNMMMVVILVGGMMFAANLTREMFPEVRPHKLLVRAVYVLARDVIGRGAGLAPAAIVGAMAIGGMASSTAGGIKAIRIGIAWKTLVHDIKRILLPESALVVTTYHAGKRRLLRDDTARAATTVLLLFVITYIVGAVVALAYGGFDITETLFESVSVGSNIGISIGVVSPEMPRGLMTVYILQMWLGRLEYVAVFALLGYLVALSRGRAKA
jgi:trk system potassium uptake protein